VKLKFLLIQSNNLSGEIPLELLELKSLGNLFIQNNNLSGVVPFENCDQFTVMEADCDVPIKISCECCTKCHGFYTAFPCTSNEIRLTFYNTTGGNPLTYKISNMEGDVIYDYEKHNIWDEGLLENKFCISPTDCLVLNLSNDTYVPFHMAISFDSKQIFNEIIYNVDTELNFGYSSTNHTVRMNLCDTFQLCNYSIEVNTS